VSSKTTVVRHAIGREARITRSYTSGVFLLAAGVGFAVVGGAATSIGLDPSPRPDGSPRNGTPFLVTGVIMLGIGVVAGTTGALHKLFNHPVEQPGATTQWRRD
jgi:hypothetical protein